MLQRNQRITLTVVLLLGVIAMITGLFVFQSIHAAKRIDVSAFHGTYLENPREINAFSLKGTDHALFNNARLKGQWTLLFFGFTHCDSLCPTTLAELGKMVRLLESRGISPLPQVVMITVDPARDNLVKLGQYAKAFDKHFMGARGSEQSVALMAKEMGVMFEKQVTSDKIEKNYQIQHSGTVMLFNPKGQLVAFFTPPHEAKFLADDYALLVS